MLIACRKMFEEVFIKNVCVCVGGKGVGGLSELGETDDISNHGSQILLQ